jgi:hypothetical protein
MARGKPAADGVNKMDLVRKALEALPDGTPKQLQAHIKQQSGLELKTLMISSYKSQLRRKGEVGAGATVGVRDLKLIGELIQRVGAPQLQALIKLMAK